jgi:hypothetical protein
MSFQVIAHDPQVKLMTCTRRRPYEGRKYARCILTTAGETYLRGKR